MTCAYGIMRIENKITAVQGSANSHAPAQVSKAPTQRVTPHRRDIIPFLQMICKGEVYLSVGFPAFND